MREEEYTQAQFNFFHSMKDDVFAANNLFELITVHGIAGAAKSLFHHGFNVGFVFGRMKGKPKTQKPKKSGYCRHHGR